MGWKNWHYWLRYGIIFVVIFFIVLSFTLIADSRIPEDVDGLRASVLPLLPGILMDSLTFDIENSYPRPSNAIFYMLFGLYSAIFWFVIGSIVGLIVGKIKSKK